ncbi:helix-turn-helix domain-containing protein [Streptomyces pristinaespiralis]|uniref:helix-turn-helix domain-containing protein n=1 Tax=Streptomyces pristinaespiralis TaxID=38300 RepID=UPI0033D54279
MNLQTDGTVVPLTAEALAERVGTTKSQILAYENGRQTPDPKRIKELADALDVQPRHLMSQGRRRQWDVAANRRASGLRAKDVVQKLCISPKSYRRFEQQGIVPVRRPRFLDDVSETLGITQRRLQAAIDNIPAVMERRQRTAALTMELSTRYVSRPGLWKGPDLEDAGILELAALYGRPPQRIRRIMTHVLGELRQTAVRMKRERVIADFDPDPARQQRAWSAIERWNEFLEAEIERIPRQLEGFHRSAQPSDAWQVLVDLHDAGTGPKGPWVVSTLLGRPETLRLLPPSLVRQQSFDGAPASQLTALGNFHVRSFHELYAALYPGLRRPRFRASRNNQGSARTAARPEASFVLPGRQERFVIPPHTLDELLLSSGGKGPFELWPTPNLRLTFGLHGGSVSTGGPGRHPAVTASDDLPS